MIDSNSQGGLSYDDTRGLIHIVILRSENIIEVREFTGTQAREQAHDFAVDAALHRAVLATVAVRVREVGSFKLHKTFSAT